MKKHLFLFCIILFSMSTFAQQFEWETNYLDATAKAKNEGRLIVVYFVDGINIEKETVIEQTIFNSEAFNNQEQPFIFLKVDETQSDSLSIIQKRYNNRIIEAFNTRRKFPSFLVTDKNATEKTELFSRFSKGRIEKIKETLKNLM